MLQRLFSRGKKEKIKYAPFGFEFFSYSLLDFTVYGEVVERTGLDECFAHVFSAAAPTGEYGKVGCSRIEHILSREQFDEARVRGWSSQ